MLESEMIEIFNQDLQNEINLFLGAGFSVYAKNKNSLYRQSGQSDGIVFVQRRTDRVMPPIAGKYYDCH